MPPAAPPFGSANDVGAVLLFNYDDRSSFNANRFVIYRTDVVCTTNKDGPTIVGESRPCVRSTKPANTMAEGDEVCIVAKEGRHYQLVGRSIVDTWFVVHDGRADFFKSMPAFVRRKFASTTSIRDFMEEDESCKVFALVMKDYQGKGPHRYELSNCRMRLGYGRCNRKLVRSDVGDTAAFFGAAATTQDATKATVTRRQQQVSKQHVNPLDAFGKSRSDTRQ